MQYQTTIEGIGAKGLASRVAGLRYDVLRDFLRALELKLQSDAVADMKRGRVALCNALNATADAIGEAAELMSTAWSVCEPHMGDVE